MKSGMLSLDDIFTRPVPDHTLDPSVNRANQEDFDGILNGFFILWPFPHCGPQPGLEKVSKGSSLVAGSPDDVF